MSDSEEEFSPEILDLPQPFHVPVTLSTTLEDHIKSDLEYIDLLLQINCAGIKGISKLSQIPKMTESLLNVIEKRRQLSLRPTHAADRKNPKAFGYEPID